MFGLAGGLVAGATIAAMRQSRESGVAAGSATTQYLHTESSTQPKQVKSPKTATNNSSGTQYLVE